MLELERYIMINLGIRLGLLHDDVVTQSQRLDSLIVEKQRGVKRSGLYRKRC